MTDPRVDVVIAVHTPDRQFERAAASVGTPGARITLVAHNTDPDEIERRARSVPGDIRVLHLADGIGSPSGPFNMGIEASTAPFVSIMGSDDFLRPGAMPAWLQSADAMDAEVVIPRLVRQSGPVVRTPPTRPMARRLDPLQDRLFYRTAPLGLLARDLLERTDFRFPAALRNGEDILVSVRAWCEARGIVRAERGAEYVVGEDAGSRVTMAHRSIGVELEAVSRGLRDPWITAQSAAVRRAFVIKVLRVHVFGAVHNRAAGPTLPAAELRDLREITARLLELAPRARTVLSRADNDLLDAILSPEPSAGLIASRAVRRRRFGHPDTLLTPSVRDLLDREAPARFMVASALVR